MCLCILLFRRRSLCHPSRPPQGRPGDHTLQCTEGVGRETCRHRLQTHPETPQQRGVGAPTTNQNSVSHSACRDDITAPTSWVTSWMGHPATDSQLLGLRVVWCCKGSFCVCVSRWRDMLIYLFSLILLFVFVVIARGTVSEKGALCSFFQYGLPCST